MRQTISHDEKLCCDASTTSFHNAEGDFRCGIDVFRSLASRAGKPHRGSPGSSASHAGPGTAAQSRKGVADDTGLTHFAKRKRPRALYIFSGKKIVAKAEMPCHAEVNPSDRNFEDLARRPDEVPPITPNFHKTRLRKPDRHAMLESTPAVDFRGAAVNESRSTDTPIAGALPPPGRDTRANALLARRTAEPGQPHGRPRLGHLGARPRPLGDRLLLATPRVNTTSTSTARSSR